MCRNELGAVSLSICIFFIFLILCVRFYLNLFITKFLLICNELKALTWIILIIKIHMV